MTKCTNDPDCVAIEDKWATGKPPIGLCKRKKGKRAGGGTYLLKKGTYTTKLLKEPGTILSYVFLIAHYRIMIFFISLTDAPAQDGDWTDWSPWTDCSRTCKPLPGDLARKYRNRSCTNPPPADGGEDCKGLDEDVELCNQNNPCGK